jgi:hypothetical protein
MSELNHSTGPKTPAGKAISSKNATVHGLHASVDFVPKGLEEEHDAYAETLGAAFLKPGFSAAQYVIFHHLKKAGWAMERIQLAMYTSGTGEVTADPISRWDYDKLQKHLNRMEASFRFYLKQLQAIQTSEILAQILPELTDKIVPALVNAKYIAATIKRTAKTASEQSDEAIFNGV